MINIVEAITFIKLRKLFTLLLTLLLSHHRTICCVLYHNIATIK